MQHSDIAAYRREKASAGDKLKKAGQRFSEKRVEDETISVYAKQRDAEMIPQTSGRRLSFP